MEKIQKILEKIDELTFKWLFGKNLLESLLTEDLEKIASDMWRRSKRSVETNRNPEKVLKSVIKLTQAVAKKAGYRDKDVVDWFRDELGSDKVPNAKREGKTWEEFFAKEYRK